MNRGVRIYVATFVVLFLAVIGNYYLGSDLTGNVVFTQYTNESTCIANNYTWTNFTNQSCTDVTNCVNQTYDCEPCLTYEDLNGTQGNCTSWTSCISTNQTCTTTQNCTTIVTGGECTGNVCDDDHLSLCLTQSNCTNATGYWRNNTCNKYECTLAEHCNSGYTCTSKKCIQIPAETTEEIVNETIIEEPVMLETVVPEFVAIKELTGDEIPSFSLISGNSQIIKWIVRNTGNVPLSECKLKIEGDSVSWVNFVDEVIVLEAGAQKEYTLSIGVPEDTLAGNNLLKVSTECTDVSLLKEFTLTVLAEKLEVNVVSTDRTSKDRVKVDYTLEELSGENQDVEIYFSLLNSDGLEVSNLSVNKSIDANKSREYKSSLKVNESLVGNLTLAVRFNSESFSNSVQKPISLSAVVGGFTIFEGVETGSIVIVVAVVVILILSFVIVKLVRKNKSKVSSVKKKKSKKRK